jgi:hypothetical protein
MMLNHREHKLVVVRYTVVAQPNVKKSVSVLSTILTTRPLEFVY